MRAPYLVCNEYNKVHGIFHKIYGELFMTKLLVLSLHNNPFKVPKFERMWVMFMVKTALNIVILLKISDMRIWEHEVDT
jgi:hypothetical protein